MRSIFPQDSRQADGGARQLVAVVVLVVAAAMARAMMKDDTTKIRANKVSGQVDTLWTECAVNAYKTPNEE